MSRGREYLWLLVGMTLTLALLAALAAVAFFPVLLAANGSLWWLAALPFTISAAFVAGLIAKEAVEARDRGRKDWT